MEDSPSTSLEVRAMLIFFYVADFSMMAIPMFVFLLLVVDPCTPPFLLSSSAGCLGIAGISQGPKFFIALFEAWVALQLIYSGAFCILDVMFTGIVAILSYCQLLGRLIFYSYMNSAYCDYRVSGRILLKLLLTLKM